MPSEPGSPMTGSNGSLNRVPPAVDIPRSPASPHWMERSPEASPPGVGGSPIGPGGGMSYPDSPAGSGAPWWPETGPGGSTSDLSDAGWSPGDDDPTGSRAAMDSASSATPMTTVPAAFVTVSPQDFLQYHRAPGSRSDMTNYGSHMPAGTVQFFTDSAVRPWRDYFLRLEFSRDTALPHLALYPRLKSRHPTIIPLFSALRIFLHGTPPPGASVQLRDCYSAGVPDVPPPRNMSHSHMFAIQTAGHLHHFCSVDMAESWVLALRQLRATARFRVLGPPRDPPPRAAYYLPPAAQAEPAVAPAAESPLPSPAPGAGDLQVPVFFLPPHRLTGDQMVSLRVGLSVIRAAAADLASPLHPPAFHFLDPLEESIPASDWPFECQLFKHLPMSMLCSSSATLVESIVTNLYFHFASFIASWSASTGDRPVAERGAAASRSQAAGTSSLEDALQSALRGSDVSTDDETFGGPGSDLAPEDIPHTTEGHFDAFADSHLFDSLLLNSSLDETVGKVRASWRLVAFTAASQSFLSITDLVNRVNTDILALVFVPVDPLFDSVALIPLSFSRSHPCFQDTGGSESPTDGTICSCALDSLSRLPLPVSTLQRLLQASPGSISCPEGAVSSVGAICERSRDVFLVLRMRAPVGLPPVSAMIPEQPVSSRNPTPLAYAQRMGALPVTGDLALRAVGLAGLLGQPVDVRQQPGSLFARDADHAAAMVSLCLGEWGAQAVTTAAAAAAAVSGVDPFAPLQHLSALGVAPAFARAAAEPAVGAQLLRLAQDTTAKFRRGATSGGGLLRRHRLFGSGATAAGAATDPELDPGRGGAPAGTAVLLPDCPRLSFEAQHSLFHLVLGYSARRLSAHVSTLPRALPMAAAPAATVAASPPASMPGTSYQPPVESPPGSPGRLFAEEVDSSASTDLDNGSGDEGADDGGTTGDGEFSDSDTEPPAGDPAGPSSPSSPAILAPVRGPSPGPAPAKASAGTPPPADQLFQPDSSSDESCAESLFETINPLDAVPPGEAALPPELQLIQHQDTDEDPDADDMVEEAGPGVLDAPLAVLTSHRSRLNLVSQPSGPAVAPSSVLGPAAEEADGPGAGAPVGPSVAELAHKRRADFALEVAHGHAQSARCLRRLMELSAAGDQLRLDPQALLLSAWQHIEPGSESGSDGGGGNVQGHVAGEVVASPGPGGPEGKGAAAAAAAAAAAGLPPLCGTAHLALERSSAGGWRRPMPGPQRPPGAPFLAAGLATPPSELEDGSAPGAYDAIPELGHILGLEAFDAACPAGLGTSFDLTIHSPEVLATLLPAVVYPDLAGRLAGHSPPKAALLDGGSALATVRMAGAGARLTLHADGRWRCSSRHLPAAGDLLSFSEGQRRRGFAAPWLRDLSSGRHRDIAAVPIQCGLDFHRLPLFAGQPPGHRTMGPASTPPPSPGGEVLPEPAPELARSWCWLGVASPGDLPAAGALDGLAAVVLSLARVPAAGGDTPGTGSPVAGQWVLRAHHPDTLLLLAGWDLVAELSAPASPEALESGPAVVPGGPPGGAVFRGSTRLDRLSAAVESAVAALTSADLFPEPSGDALSSSEGEDAEVHAEGSSPRLAGPGAASSGRSPSLDAGPSGDLRLHGQFLALGAMEFRPVGRELSGLGDLPLLSPDFSLAPGPAPAEVCPIDSVQDSQLLQPIDPANFFSSLLRSYAFVLDFLLVQQQSPVVEPECLSMWKCASDGAPVGPGPGPSPAAGPASGALGASDKRSFLSSLMDTVSVVRPGFGDGPAGGDSSGGVAAGGAPLSLLSPAAGHPVRSARAFGRQCLCPDALSREIRAGLFDACCQVLVSDVRLGVSPPHEVLLDSPVDLAWWQAWQAVLLAIEHLPGMRIQYWRQVLEQIPSPEELGFLAGPVGGSTPEAGTGTSRTLRSLALLSGVSAMGGSSGGSSGGGGGSSNGGGAAGGGSGSSSSPAGAASSSAADPNMVAAIVPATWYLYPGRLAGLQLRTFLSHLLNSGTLALFFKSLCAALASHHGAVPFAYGPRSVLRSKDFTHRLIHVLDHFDTLAVGTEDSHIAPFCSLLRPSGHIQMSTTVEARAFRGFRPRAGSSIEAEAQLSPVWTASGPSSSSAPGSVDPPTKVIDPPTKVIDPPTKTVDPAAAAAVAAAAAAEAVAPVGSSSGLGPPLPAGDGACGATGETPSSSPSLLDVALARVSSNADRLVLAPEPPVPEPTPEPVPEAVVAARRPAPPVRRPEIAALPEIHRGGFKVAVRLVRPAGQAFGLAFARDSLPPAVLSAHGVAVPAPDEDSEEEEEDRHAGQGVPVYRVSLVHPGTPAAQNGGLRPGDTILAMGGRGMVGFMSFEPMEFVLGSALEVEITALRTPLWPAPVAMGGTPAPAADAIPAAGQILDSMAGAVSSSASEVVSLFNTEVSSFLSRWRR